MLLKKITCITATLCIFSSGTLFILQKPVRAEIKLPSSLKQPLNSNRDTHILPLEKQSRARTYQVFVSARQEWVNTGITISPGQTVSIRATGQWTNVEGNHRPLDADGYRDYYRSDAMDGSAQFASLIGWHPSTGNFPVGSYRRRSFNTSGTLYLTMNDLPGTFTDNSGTLTVNITVE